MSYLAYDYDNDITEVVYSGKRWPGNWHLSQTEPQQLDLEACVFPLGSRMSHAGKPHPILLVSLNSTPLSTTRWYNMAPELAAINQHLYHLPSGYD